MVQVTLTASVKVLGGPTLPVSSALTPESYTFASVSLGAAGADDAEHEVALLPTDGTVVLLAVNARTAAGAGASVVVTPSDGAAPGNTELAVAGSLVVANANALAALVAGGPRAVTIRNVAPEPVTVDILTCLGPAA
jgi:hypothetical protein